MYSVLAAYIYMEGMMIKIYSPRIFINTISSIMPILEISLSCKRYARVGLGLQIALWQPCDGSFRNPSKNPRSQTKGAKKERNSLLRVKACIYSLSTFVGLGYEGSCPGFPCTKICLSASLNIGNIGGPMHHLQQVSLRGRPTAWLI